MAQIDSGIGSFYNIHMNKQRQLILYYNNYNWVDSLICSGGGFDLGNRNVRKPHTEKENIT